MATTKDSNSWMKINNAKRINSGARGFLTWQRKGNGKWKGGPSWQSQTNLQHNEIIALIACKHNKHVAHKKCWYEGEHSTYCVGMEQDIWTTSKHDTFKNPRNRRNAQR